MKIFPSTCIAPQAQGPDHEVNAVGPAMCTAEGQIAAGQEWTLAACLVMPLHGFRNHRKRDCFMSGNGCLRF